MRKSLSLIKAGTYLGTRWFIDKIVHKERAPFSKGKMIIAPNHSSLVDGLILGAYINKHRTTPLHIVVQEESFQNKFFHYMLRSARCIPVDRKSPQSIENMFKTTLAYLQRDEIVGIFPEGHVNNGNTLRLPRPGTALLALESGAPILPVGMRGFEKIFTIGSQKFNFTKRGEIHFGKIIDTEAMSKEYHQAESTIRMKLVDSLSTRIMQSIAELSGMQLHRRML